MKSSVRVMYLKNHGVRVITESARGRSERFEAHAGGSVTIVEASAALHTYPMKLYRLIESGAVKSRRVSGTHRIPVAELQRLRRDRTALEDARKRRDTAA